MGNDGDETIFQVEEIKLPHDGVIPGAAGHKKITVPKGTRVYLIREPRSGKYFWCGYLYIKEALETAKSFVETIKPEHKRHIPLNTLIEWNFKGMIPKRIHRPKEDVKNNPLH